MSPNEWGSSYEGGDSECFINYLRVSIIWKCGQSMNKK